MKKVYLTANGCTFFLNSCFKSMCNPMGYDRSTPCFFIYMPGLKPPISLSVLRFLAAIYLGLWDSPPEFQPFFYCSVSKLVLRFLITLLLPLQLSLSCCGEYSKNDNRPGYSASPEWPQFSLQSDIWLVGTVIQLCYYLQHSFYTQLREEFIGIKPWYSFELTQFI